MVSRQEMMARIRVALGRAPHQASPVPPPDPVDLPELGQVMPPIEPSEVISKFVTEFEKVSTKVWKVASLSDLEAILSELVKSRVFSSAVLSRNPLLSKLNLAERLRRLGLEVSAWPEVEASPEAQRAFREHCFAAPVGFTGVDYALAETGSLVISSLTEGAQLASLAPPVHVAMVGENQIVANLEDVLAGIAVSHDSQSRSPGRSVVFVTGSSRTADIEQIVVRGVHGPQEVHAILLGEACLGGSSQP